MNRADYIFGIRPVLEALDACKSIDKIFVRRELTGVQVKEIVVKAREYDIPVQRVPLEKLNRITMKNHQGVIAVISPIRYHDLDNLIAAIYEEGRIPLAVMLDGVTDAGNFGAIARSAECAGADFLIIPEKGSASATSDAVRASAGALMHIPVCRGKNLVECVRRLQDNGYKVIGASEKGATVYTTVDMTVPVLIIMGAEDKGIGEDLLKRCDEIASIPVRGHVGSLNVSVAAGVMLFEAVRQRSL